MEALKRYVASGGRVCLATGRGRSFTTALARSLSERGLDVSDLICSDGALVVARSGPGEWATVVHNTMPSGNEIASVISALYQHIPGVAFGVETDDMGVIISDQHYISTINVRLWDRAMLAALRADSRTRTPLPPPHHYHHHQLQLRNHCLPRLAPRHGSSRR